MSVPKSYRPEAHLTASVLNNNKCSLWSIPNWKFFSSLLCMNLRMFEYVFYVHNVDLAKINFQIDLFDAYSLFIFVIEGVTILTHWPNNDISMSF